MNTLDVEKATILLVDDTPNSLALMSSLLKDDYRVKIARDGETALKIALSGAPPDLILLDIMMPGMDGYEVCRRLKREPGAMNIPVIFLTARADVGDEEKGLELGAADYIAKPISPPIVMARVKNHLALKAMADFLKEKNLELENAKAVAERASLAKSSFLSSMSHELRSPLNAILGFGQLLAADTPPPTPIQQESITQILQAGWHLLTLINEILDLAKIESGQVPMPREPVSLADVVLECQGMIEPQAQQHGIRMAFHDLDAGCFVLADATRVKQVLLNLLTNAIKYNARQGAVDVQCAESTPGRIRVSVRDTGAGLPPEDLAQLFQPFNRLGQEAGGVEGTGIGLVVAKRLVELMGGAIGAESTVGTGSVFWFELNSVAAPRFALSAGEAVESARAGTSRAARLHTLLYVENDPTNLKLVEKIIARHPDLRLLTAVNGKRGIEIARASQPDVILMDINMPGISGIEALKILHQDQSTAHIPLIAVSANAMPLDIERGMKAGFFRYITKPIKVNEFMDSLDMALTFAEQNRRAANWAMASS
jgi:signal transduction histidine kinase